MRIILVLGRKLAQLLTHVYCGNHLFSKSVCYDVLTIPNTEVARNEYIPNLVVGIEGIAL